MDLLAFKVVIEPDEDVWQSYYPAWEHLGAATCGETQEEAAINIKEVLEMIVGEIEEGMIEWPIEPCAPDWDFSQPSIQSEPELVQLNCNHEHPGAVAEHGGLPVLDPRVRIRTQRCLSPDLRCNGRRDGGNVRSPHLAGKSHRRIHPQGLYAAGQTRRG